MAKGGSRDLCVTELGARAGALGVGFSRFAMPAAGSAMTHNRLTRPRVSGTGGWTAAERPGRQRERACVDAVTTSPSWRWRRYSLPETEMALGGPARGTNPGSGPVRGAAGGPSQARQDRLLPPASRQAALG